MNRYKPAESMELSGVRNALGGVIVAVVFWYFANVPFGFAGVAALRDAGWPVSTAWLAAAVGAVFGVRTTWRNQRKEAERVAAIRETVTAIGLTYSEETPRPTATCTLSCFAGWNLGVSGTHGEVGGTIVSVFDAAKWVDDGEGGYTVWQTVALVPASGLLRFLVTPRGFFGWLVDAVGDGGMTIDLAAVSPKDAEAVRRFQKAFWLTSVTTAESPENGASEVTRTNEDAVRRLFTPALMQAFLEHPGCFFESDGEWLACHRGSSVLPPKERPELMAALAVIRSALLAALADLPTEGLPPLSHPTPGQYSVRVMGILGGVVVGSAVGFFSLGGLAFEVFGLRGAVAVALPFVGMVFGGIAGGFLGYCIGAAIGLLPAVKRWTPRPAKTFQLKPGWAPQPAETPEPKLTESPTGCCVGGVIGMMLGSPSSILLFSFVIDFLFPNAPIWGGFRVIVPGLGGGILGGIAGARLGLLLTRRRNRAEDGSESEKNS